MLNVAKKNPIITNTTLPLVSLTMQMTAAAAAAAEAEADSAVNGEPESTLLTDSTVDGEPESTLLPDSSVDFEPESTLLLRQRNTRVEIDRIRTDSAARVRHAVPVDDDDDDNKEPGSRWYGGWKTLVTKEFCKDYWTRIVPCQQWLFQYSLKTFWHDLAAGVTVAVMAVPLSMSYANLAGLPAYYGLYATFTPPFVYAIFGTSRQLAVSPAALVSLLLSSGLTSIVEREGIMTDSAEYVPRYTTLAIQCSFLAGLILLAMGLFRMGFVTQFLSRSLISGFTSGAAVIIAVSQMKYILGYDIPSSDKIYELIASLSQNISQFNWKTFVMGSLSILVLISIKHLSRKFPKFNWIKAISPSLVSVVAIILVVTLNLDERGIPLVDTIPRGLPSVTVDLWTPVSATLLIPVLAMVVVGFVQGIAIAKRLAYKHGYHIDSSQELVALGMSNLVGGMFQSFPVTGAFGQTAANDETGAKTGLASVITAVVVLPVLMFLTPVFSKMPLSVLAAIVISFVSVMFEYKEAIYLWRVHKFDFTVWMVAFLGTMFLGIAVGLTIAAVVSILIVFYESAYPPTAVLGRLPGTKMFRNIKQYPGAERYDGLVIIRIDAPLYFANASNVRDKVRKYLRVAADELAARDGGDVKYLILDMSPVSHVDTTTLHVLEDMYSTNQRLGVQICFANPGINVMERLVKCGFYDLVGREHIFSSVINAVDWCFNDAYHGGAPDVDQEAQKNKDECN